jgi:sialate O-acetylesterase
MVMQQNAEVEIWGWAKANEVVKITVSWAKDKVYEYPVKSNGDWRMTIQTPKAGGPHSIIIKGYNTITIEDILMGEVWLGSGQSNMEWPLNGDINDAKVEIRTADYPDIRMFTVSSSTADFPQQHLVGEWVVCSPETVANFSATMYFFGRALHNELNAPVGLIHSSWGGTPVEVWIPEPRIALDKKVKENASILETLPWGPHLPGKAFNAMIHPLIPFTIKGVIWYQGETNTRNPTQYARSFSLLIDSWRDLWGYEFPFYYAQIAPYKGYGEDNVNGAIIRDQQRKVLDMVDNTGMIVTSDIGNLDDIHPRNKQDVGKRLALWAFNKVYGKSNIGFSGPMIDTYEVSNDRITLSFKYDVGLHSYDDPVYIETTKDGENWNTVKGLIVNDRLILETPDSWKIKKIRYAYKNDALGTIFNNHGLPASTFELKINEGK